MTTRRAGLQQVADALGRRVAGVPRSGRELAQLALLSSSLRRLGWYPGRHRGAADGAGSPVPWLTHGATQWLDQVLRDRHRVLEFGSGSSTRWLAARAAHVTSVEDDPSWAQWLRPTLPPNTTLRWVHCPSEDGPHVDESDPYVRAIEVDDEPFDVVLVDGRGRNACVRASMTHLTADGVLILDDADRLEYRPSFDLLASAGFGRIDFFGTKFGVGHLSTTSAFSRSFDAWVKDLAPPPASGY